VHEANRSSQLPCLGIACFLVGAFVIPTGRLRRVPLSSWSSTRSSPGHLYPPRIVRLLASRRRNGVLKAPAGALRRGQRPIVRELRGNPVGLDPVGFVDDDRSKHGNRVSNLPVLGSLAELPSIIEKHSIDEVVIAMPRAPGSVIREVLDAAAAAKVKTRTVPGMFDIISGRVAIRALRKVEIQDLLRRDPVTTSLEAVRSIVMGHTVLVTGAGGSIGSELCRQLDLGPSECPRGPRRELHLRHPERAAGQCGSNSSRRSDVRDRELLNQAFRQWTPIAVFHAAAHKHVPMMERNVTEAITNNILGTRNVVELAAEHGVERLVLISTDKAVHPTNVMGATKRVAEMVVQMAARDHRRNFVSVRFGNVLGSRGSVVPTFLKQIAAVPT
jgi:FlaA1/EpsC-like NDP-sugar epimerase